MSSAETFENQVKHISKPDVQKLVLVTSTALSIISKEMSIPIVTSKKKEKIGTGALDSSVIPSKSGHLFQ